jgi:hypothetical protein
VIVHAALSVARRLKRHGDGMRRMKKDAMWIKEVKMSTKEVVVYMKKVEAVYG